jgi:hypothetical protein
VRCRLIVFGPGLEDHCPDPTAEEFSSRLIGWYLSIRASFWCRSASRRDIDEISSGGRAAEKGRIWERVAAADSTPIRGRADAENILRHPFSGKMIPASRLSYRIMVPANVVVAGTLVLLSSSNECRHAAIGHNSNCRDRGILSFPSSTRTRRFGGAPQFDDDRPWARWPNFPTGFVPRDGLSWDNCAILS